MTFKANKLSENIDADLSWFLFNPLPNDIILNRSKLKGFADDKIYGIGKIEIFLGRVDNIRQGEKASSLGLLKVMIVWKRVKGANLFRFMAQ